MKRPRPLMRLKQYRAWLKKLSWGKRAAMIVLTIITPFLLYFGADMGSRAFLSDEPSIVHIDNGLGAPDTSVVYVGGAGSSPTAQSVGLVPVLMKYGKDVYIVENAPDLFSIDPVVKLIAGTIKGDEKVTFVAGSMGGLVVYDTIATLRAQGDNRYFGVILIDAPTGWDDVVGVKWPFKVLSGLRLGIPTNLWFPAQFDRNAPAVIDINADRNQLEKLWHSYETWKASSWGDQGRYVFFHDSMTKLKNVGWFFIRSGADSFVGSLAYDNWVAAQGPMLYEIVPDSAHLALLNRPSFYNKAVENGFAVVSPELIRV